MYDEELNCEPYKKIGIKTLKPFKIDKNIKKALNKMSKINEEILDKKLFPMTFGGEHSITPGCIAPFTKKGKERQQTYSPFLPICPDSGHVLEIPVIEIDKEKSKIIFDNKGKKFKASIYHNLF